MRGMASRASDLILAGLHALHPKSIDLSLGRVERLLAALDHPERRLAPVVHIAGTNGKGSTLAMLAAMLQAAGRRVDRYISPHLVAFNERILIDGAPIAEERLARCLERCEVANAGLPITFFEITTAAAFLAFAEGQAEWVLLETGLGGRLDATNVVARPRLCLISPVSMDHESYLGDTLAKIASEKAGILKPGVPAVIAAQPPDALAAIEERAAEVGAPLLLQDRDWGVWPTATGLRVEASGRRLELPRPVLAGTHQIGNAGLAVAAALQLDEAKLDTKAIGRGLEAARWPARLQRLVAGAIGPSRPAGYDGLAGRRPQSGGRSGAGRQSAGPAAGPGAPPRGRHALDQGCGTVPGTSAAAGGEHTLRPHSRRGFEPRSSGHGRDRGAIGCAGHVGGFRRGRGGRPSSRSKRHPTTS